MKVEINTLEKMKAFNTLREFLGMSVFSTDEVFNKFSTDKGGNLYEIDGQKFYFKPGTRKDSILLVAHADTVWDKRYKNFGLIDENHWDEIEKNGYIQEKPIEKFNAFHSGSKNYGLGADDRAGAAIVWLLKDSGNSILITDCEEIGAFSARNIMKDEYFRDIINSHRYMLQFDLNGKNKFKCYSAGSDDFKAMMEVKTKLDMLPNFSFTDIAVLGKKICGANLATGYKFDHTPYETLVKKDWYKCYKIAKKLSKSLHQQFNVDPEFGYKHFKDEKFEDYQLNEFEDDNPFEDSNLNSNSEKFKDDVIIDMSGEQEQEIERM